MATLTIKGIDELRAKLGALEAGKLLRPVMTAAVERAKSAIAVYPPASEANTPNQRRWYERGWGSKWMRADGTVGGKKSSEMLGRSWTTSVAQDGRSAEVGTKVTYAQYVQDRDFQPAFHKNRGWRTVQDVAEEQGPEIVKMIEDEINRILGGA